MSKQLELIEDDKFLVLKFRRHWSYVKYLARHKAFVFLAGLVLRVSLWRLIIHDWHKFTPFEWRGYVETFYDVNGTKRYVPTSAFDHAWNHHQKVGKHHWQYWVMITDNGQLKPLDMPEKYIREMIADWWGAGRTITGKWDAITWYRKNEAKMMFSDLTRARVCLLLDVSAQQLQKHETTATISDPT